MAKLKLNFLDFRIINDDFLFSFYLQVNFNPTVIVNDISQTPCRAESAVAYKVQLNVADNYLKLNY